MASIDFYVSNEEIFVLSIKKYKDNSFLLDVLSKKGRFSAIYNNPKDKRVSPQLFTLLEAQIKLNKNFKILSSFSTLSLPYISSGESLFIGFYLNELIIQLIKYEEQNEKIFSLYFLALKRLNKSNVFPPILRFFEWELLKELGYSFSLMEDISGAKIEETLFYEFIPEHGLSKCKKNLNDFFCGKDLLLMSASNWKDPNIFISSKKLMRMALSPYLKNRLKSRELFMNYMRMK